MALENAAVIGLLGLIASVDLAQFTLQMRHERRLTRLEEWVK